MREIETFAPVCHDWPEISLDLRSSLLGRAVDVLVEYALVLTFMCCAEMMATAQKKTEIWMCKIWMCKMGVPSTSASGAKSLLSLTEQGCFD